MVKNKSRDYIEFTCEDCDYEGEILEGSNCPYCEEQLSNQLDEDYE